MKFIFQVINKFFKCSELYAPYFIILAVLYGRYHKIKDLDYLTILIGLKFINFNSSPSTLFNLF